ncbi:MAG: isochorismatase family protein [Proteobacteria bacterium]|nr:isochorismatase family protein [Pseudomonadota bacterium]
MLLDADDCQLVLIDYQARLMPAIHEGPSVLANARRLAQLARLFGVPVWATEQNPSKLGGTDEAVAALCDRIVPKMAFSGAAELQPLLAPPAPAPRGNARSLPRHLQKAAPVEPSRGALVIAGCEAHVCLLQTTLTLLESEDWDVWVVTDACGSRTERNRDAAYDRLASAGCELVTTEMVAFEWLHSCEHPQFRAVQALVK